MRTWCASLLLIHSACAQFSFFGDSERRTSQIEAIGDQFGVREALGAWSKVLRNMATRPQIKKVNFNPNEFTIAPNVKREELEKALVEKKKGDNIINERLLYLLLPRIKGQPPFTTTTLPTTTTITTTTTPPPTTSTSTTTSTTTPATDTTLTSTAPSGTTVGKNGSTNASVPPATSSPSKFSNDYPSKARWSEEDSKEFELDSSELAILERQYTKRLAHLKAQKKERESRRPTDSEHDAKQSDIDMKSTVTTDAKISSTKRSTSLSSTVTELPATKAPPRNGQQFTVVFHTPAKERFEEKSKIESKVLSILSKALKDHDRKLEKIPKAQHANGALSEGLSSTISPTLKSATDEDKGVADAHPTSVERVAEFALRKALKEKGQDDEPQLAAPNRLYSLTSSSVESIEDFSPNAQKSGINFTKMDGSARYSGSSATTTLLGSSEEANEVNEVLALIEADEKAEKAEASSDTNEIKRLREETRAKIMAFLQKRVDKMTAELDRTTTPSRTTLTTTSHASTATTNVPISTGTTTVMSTTTSTATSTTSTVASTASTTVPSSTTKKGKGTEQVAFKQIPEAEEEELAEAAARNTATTTTTSTMPRETSTSSYNFKSSGNIEPKLASVISPIAGIIDNIGPIIAPLLRARAAAAAKTAGVRTYEPPGRDLLVHSDGENSIIGYGTQLAREILNPGSLQRDREEKQRALAAKIAQVKENLKYTSISGNEARTIPIYQALKPPPLSQPNYVQPFSQAQVNAAHPALPPFFVAPPPGYVGPLPPPPPPPPPPLPPSRYPVDTPRRAPSSKISPVNGINATTSTTSNHPVYYPVQSDKQPAFTIESYPTELPKPIPVVVPVQRGPDSTGFENGRSGVRSTFLEDSGLMLGGQEPINVSPPAVQSLSFEQRPSTENAGFGGGRRPTESFEQAASSSVENSSSFRMVRRKLMKH